MRDCGTFAPMLGSRPGELAPDEEARLRAHLADCEACQARLADLLATDGMVADALQRAAARRDFASFADEVMARIPAGAWTGRDAAATRVFGSLRAFFRRHKVVAVASALAPALAAALLYLFVERSGPAASVDAGEPGVEVMSETLAPVVLDTSDGPVILVGDSDGT